MNGTTATGWLLHTLAGGGLLLLLAWGWAAWTRQPVRRLRVAEWAVAASLLLAVLSLGPAWIIVTTPAPAPTPALSARKAETSTQESRAPAPPAPTYAPAAASPIPDVPAPAPAPPAPHRLAAAPPAWSWDAGHVAAVAAWLYLVAAAVVLGRWLLGWAALARLLRRCQPVTGRAAGLFAEMAGPDRRPRLLGSPRVRAPFSCGLLRSAVVLPAALCDAPEEALRWVFAHELAHVRRRDAWSGLLFGLAQAVYFAVPWFWPLRRQARLCQEYLADAEAASAAGRPEDYAQFLLAWTAAPRLPVGARGVWGRSSDLFWRVKTMLQNPTPLERRCPRRWSLAAAAGLLSLAVFAGGLTLRASAAPAAEPNKDEPKPQQPKADQPKAEQPAVPDLPLPDFDDVFKNLPPGFDADQAKILRQQMQQLREQMRRNMQMQNRFNGFNGLNPVAPFNPAFPNAQQEPGRLGVAVEKPSDTLVDQLELPHDQGLIVQDVTPDSPAAKAGLKPHDILLEVDGKPVPNDPTDFRRQVEGIKANTPVDVVVMRKGRKETLKGVSLPEAKPAAAAQPGQPAVPGFPGVAPNFPNLNIANGGNGVSTTTVRTNDSFLTRRMEPGLFLTVKGKVVDGKATVSEIDVQDPMGIYKYDSVEKAPEKYRDTLKEMVEASEKGSVKVDVKAP